MRSCRTLLVAAWMAMWPQAASAFSGVFFFGDSLSDTGNGCAVLQIAGYAPGRCSNGPVWSDRLAEALGFEAEPSLLGGDNFANGGDVAEDLALQVGLFALRQLGRADPEALYVIWIGGNDVLGTPSDPGAMQQAVDDVVAAIDDLATLGARSFLVANLPDVGRSFGSFSFPEGSGSPFGATERDQLTALSLDFNARLDQALDALVGIEIFRLDVFALVEEIFADPARFGIVPAAIDSSSSARAFGVPCLTDAGCAADPQGSIADGFLLFDAIHPTTAVHARIGERAATLLPVPDPDVLRSLALLATLALARRQRALPASAGQARGCTR